MTVYLPTVISTPRAERVIRPEQWRTRRFVSNDELGQQGKLWEYGLGAAYLFESPGGNYHRNSAADVCHGFFSANNPVSKCLAFDDQLGRWVLDWSKQPTLTTLQYAITGHPLANASAFTFAAWLKVDTAATGGQFCTVASSSGGPGLLIGPDFSTGVKFRVYLNEGGNYRDYFSDDDYPVGRWFRAVVGWNTSDNSGKPRLWIDGTEKTLSLVGNSGTMPTAITGGAGQVRVQNYNWTGRMGDQLIWNTNRLGTSATWLGPYADAALNGGQDVDGYIRELAMPNEGTTNHRTAIPVPAIPSNPSEPFEVNHSDPVSVGLTAWFQANGPSLGRGMADATGRTDYLRHVNYTDAKTIADPTLGLVWAFDAADSDRAVMQSAAATTYQSAIGFSQNGFTVECLHKIDDLSNGETWQNMASYGAYDTISAINWMLRAVTADGSYQFQFHATPPAFCNQTTGAGVVQEGEWMHLVYTHPGGAAGQFYLQGEPVSSTVTAGDMASAITNPNVQFRLGAIESLVAAVHVEELTGKIALLRIWQRPLNAREVRHLYDGVIVGRDPLRAVPNNAGRRIPIAPVSNARTAAPRIVTLPSPSYTPSPFEPFEVNWDDDTTKGLTAWFQANASLGRIMRDVTERTAPLDRVPYADSYVANDPTHGPVWKFVAADDTRSTMLISSPFNDYYSTLAFTQGGFTVECLHRCDLLNNGEVQNLQHLAAYGAYDTGISPNLNKTNWALRLSGTTLVYDFYFRDNSDTAWNIHRSDAAAVEGAWAHIVYSHPGGAAGTFYYNGQALGATVASGDVTATPVTSVNAPLKFGAVYTFATTEHYQQLTGQIGLIRIWQRPLNAREVDRLATAVLAGRDPLRKPLSARNPILIHDRHWVGETSEWFNPSNWSRAAGGVRGAGVPGCGQPVYFDADRPEYP